MLPNHLKEFEKKCLAETLPIIGQKRAEWLYNKVKEAKPKKVLELGTLSGYSGCILTSQGAKLTTVEIDPETAEEARENFKRFKIDAEIIVGDGVKVTKDFVKSGKKFDLIFIDFMQRSYIEVLEDCIKLVKKGGLIIADNVNFPKCKDYKEAVLKHPKLKTEIIDIEKGLACSRAV